MARNDNLITYQTLQQMVPVTDYLNKQIIKSKKKKKKASYLARMKNVYC